MIGIGGAFLQADGVGNDRVKQNRLTENHLFYNSCLIIPPFDPGMARNVRMHHDFIDDLLEALNRIIEPDRDKLRELLIFNGMPEDTQNLRYLSYNQQQVVENESLRRVSIAAVINNRRVAQWRLSGYREKISQIVFNPRWTRSPVDIFLIRLRCQAAVMNILEAATARYTLFGILQVQKRQASGWRRGNRNRIHPVVALPGASPEALAAIQAFEQAAAIKRRPI
ncbi:MAG: hypothetical protein QNI88_10250 [Desulfobacterales bacterium]|nr:hypothetical protein [Desulfobacterales bacterium]